MLDIVQPNNDDSNENDTYQEVFLMRIIPETDQLFQCHVNRISRLLNGLTTEHY
jgi:hypothetical protein